MRYLAMCNLSSHGRVHVELPINEIMKSTVCDERVLTMLVLERDLEWDYDIFLRFTTERSIHSVIFQ